MTARFVSPLIAPLALALALTACGGRGGDQAALPRHSAGAPSTTATSAPMTKPTKPPPTHTAAGPVTLASHSTNTYGGLDVVVDLPGGMSSASRPPMQAFSDLLQAVGRTTAQNKLDPSLSGLASADVVKYLRTGIIGGSVQGIGSLTFTISNVHTVPRGPTLVTGCADQSKIVQVRKDGSHFVDAGAKKNPKLKMTANIDPANAGGVVTRLTFSVGTC
jgi:hypothetical protein